MMNLEIISDSDRFAELEGEWNGCLASTGRDSVFLTHEWFSAWWRAFGRGGRLEILKIERSGGGTAGFVPLMERDGLLTFLASGEVTDYCDCLTVRGAEEEVCSAVIDHLVERLGAIREVSLINLKEGSPSLALLPRLAGERGLDSRQEETEFAPVLDLPADYETYLGGLRRKDRHELRRKIKRIESLESAYARSITRPDEVRDLIRAFMDLHRGCAEAKAEFWQKAGVPDFFDALLPRLAERGWLRMEVLYHGPRIIGMLIAFHYNDELSLYNVAHDREFASLSPGIYLFHRAISGAFELGVKRIDFLRGSEKYKYYFGAKNSRILTLTIKRIDRLP